MTRRARKNHLLTTILAGTITIIVSILWFMIPPTVTEGKEQETINSAISTEERQGKYVIVYLQKMELELRDGGTIIKTLPLLSKGKPGSYYETIGGEYTNDYKIPLHFSSLGHVYMPHSIHIFGNYFIHGIPYYPNGEPVSSTHSGGCIRLTNENAKIVYDFVQKGTPIIITKSNDTEFTPTRIASTTLLSSDITNLMIAAISLEFLSQDDDVILDTDGKTKTTRKTILPRLVTQGDTSVARLYANALGEKVFLRVMNEKAEALGLTNTYFVSLSSPVLTTEEDYRRFMDYITTYKSYLRTIPVISSPL